MLDYQMRVIEEREQLVERFRKLVAFIPGSVFNSLPSDEQNCLIRQSVVMLEYADILAERIAAFGPDHAS